ncbi:MAG TPA: hypothetical protein VFD92_12390 [Candidatus Binatia bacterium]|nr:hypothetical protein [Candidatus Binatia bacterium]
MGVVAVSGIAFAAMFGAAIVGTLLRSILPERYLSDESKEVIRLGSALIATMSALLLGLLVASTRGAYEEKRSQVIRMTADLIELDLCMKDYGAEARPVRQAMRDAVPAIVDGIWRGQADRFRSDANAEPDTGTEAVLSELQELSPRDDGQRARRARAIEVGLDLAQIQLVLFSQPDNAISPPFITVMVLWLAFIFGTFTLFAPPNPLIVAVLLVSALSAASALFLILDLDSPFAGLLQIPAAPLRNALPPLAILLP